MLIIKSILSLVFLIIISISIGFATTLFFAQKSCSFFICILKGFIIYVALFEIVALPCIIFNLSFNILYYTALLCTVFLFFACVIYILTNTTNIKYKISITPYKIILCIISLIIGIYISYFHINAGDDGCYIAISNIALEQNQIQLNDQIAYSGNTLFSACNCRPGIASWELFIAFLCKTFKLHPAIFAHSIIPIILIPLCYLAIYYLFQKIFIAKESVFGATLIYILLTLSFGPYLPMLIWVGKTLLFFLCFPILFSLAIDIYNEKETRETWFLIFIIMILSCACSATGCYMTPFYFIVLGLPYLIKLIINKNATRLFAILYKSICSLSGILLIDLYILIYIKKNGSTASHISVPEYLVHPEIRCYGYNYYLIILSLIIILLLKIKPIHKLLVCGSSIVAFCLFLNPLFQTQMTAITSDWLYWRLYFLLSGWIPICICSMYLLNLINSFFKNNMQKYCIPHILFFFVLITYTYKLPTNIFLFYGNHQNIYMIPNNAFEIATELENLSKKDNYTVLLPSELLAYVRQYSSHANVIDVKYGDTLKLIQANHLQKEEKDLYKYIHLIQEVYTEYTLNNIQSINSIDYFDVNYIVSKYPITSSSIKLTLISIIDSYYIYQL